MCEPCASNTHVSVYIGCVDSEGNLKATDRWSYKPALVSLTTVAVLALLIQIPGSVSFLLIPLAWLGFGIFLFVIPSIAIYCFIKRCPRRGVSVFLMLLLPVLLWWPINRAADLVHLGLTAGFGVGQLCAYRSRNGDFVAYDWSVGLASDPSTFLIYDKTGKIALPVAQHTHPLSSEDGLKEACAGRVRHLIGHYYICNYN